MLSQLFGKIFLSPNEKFIRRIAPIVTQINDMEGEIKSLSDDQLRHETGKMKDIVAQSNDMNHTLESLLPKSFAMVREASRRVLNKRHYDVQLIGGVVLHKGLIAEMRTGEGKTLVATLPAYLNALCGKGVHIVTTNDYLVKRDSEWMGKVYKFLGMEVRNIVSNMSDTEKHQAYNADITYGTNNEFAFDYLRDNLKFGQTSMVQKPFNYAIIDEVDSVLIDEARTPLIISGKSNDDPALYGQINSIIKSLPNTDYEVDEKARNVLLTEDGQHNIEEIMKQANIISSNSSLYDIENITILHHIDQSLKAHTLFKKDVDYIVKDKSVLIIDEHTGRVMDGRRYSDGLHQAIEAKENVKIQNENQTIASITFQNYFRMYPKLSGMTGTAMTEAVEFAEIYGLQVISVPTNLPIRCLNEDDVIYRTAQEKYQAIIDEIKSANAKQQPILVGTTSVEKSEYLSSLLKKAGIKHNVLNAKYHEAEAEIIGQAGRASAVTIATNMAGRGTDILLGGNPEMMSIKILKEKYKQEPEENRELFEEIFSELKKEAQREQAVVKEAGGLFVIGTERHESRRIDDQLRGRAGRQGDNGRTKFFLSMEDDLMRLFGSEKISALLLRLGLKEGEAIVHPWVSKSLEKAQQKVEARNYEIRKNILQYDDVMNDQRYVMYSRRNEILNSDEKILEIFKSICMRQIEKLVDMFADNADIENLDIELHGVFGFVDTAKKYVEANGEINRRNKRAIIEHLNNQMEDVYKQKIALLGEKDIVQVIQKIALMTLDYLWKEHLHNLDQLRLGINLRSYGQKNPLMEYKHEAFTAFTHMLESFEVQLIERVFKVSIVYQDNANTGDSDAIIKMQRNQLCYCGSGKRYKHCHGKISDAI